MKKELICEIAECEGLESIMTTTAKNGYPKNLREAIIGFETYDQAEKLAEQYGFSIELFKRQYGWQLWTRCGWRPEPLKITAEDYGDDFFQYDSTEEVLSQLKDKIYYTNSVDEIITMAEDARGIIEAINDCGPGEFVITCNGCYYETVAEEAMRWEHDSKTFVIGVIDKD